MYINMCVRLCLWMRWCVRPCLYDACVCAIHARSRARVCTWYFRVWCFFHVCYHIDKYRIC